MTEEGAKRKWCPMMQVTGSEKEGYGDNRGGGDEDHNCIASDCMLWVEDIPAGKASGEVWLSSGHCGLAK